MSPAPHRTLILGGPGCGKTTRLLNVVEEEMARGVPANAIAFVAFTKAAAEEAKLRAGERFGLNPQRDLPYFRTIHSLAYLQLGCARDDMMSQKDWQRFGTMIGDLSVLRGADLVDGPRFDADFDGRAMLRLVDLSRAKRQPLRNVWKQEEEVGDWWALERFELALTRYKLESGKREFADLLTDYVNGGHTAGAVRVAIIDEAQDLTSAQWAMLQQAFAGAERWYIAGDDDQAIYYWAGADVRAFLNLRVDATEVLPVTHRLSRDIFATAQQLSSRISSRYAKPYQVRPDAPLGRVDHWQDLDSIPWHAAGTESWLCIARHRYLLPLLENWARTNGALYQTTGGKLSVPYAHYLAIRGWTRWTEGKDATAEEVQSIAKVLARWATPLREGTNVRALAGKRYTAMEWQGAWGLTNGVLARPWWEVLDGIGQEDANYYRTILRRGQNLRTPRLRIDTIHGVKGAEADTVLLMTDQTSRAIRSMALTPDHEHRVFFVGATRAKTQVHVVAPTGAEGYLI